MGARYYVLPSNLTMAMAELTVGVIDVYVVSLVPEFRVLLMRRAAGVRCTGAWEAVHGSIEEDERPEEAALREFGEETGLTIDRLYSYGCNPFYLPRRGVVQVAVGFAAVVSGTPSPRLGDEHDAWEWLSLEEATDRATWPRTRQALREVHQLLRGGDAGPAEDVLRIPIGPG